MTDEDYYTISKMIENAVNDAISNERKRLANEFKCRIHYYEDNDPESKFDTERVLSQIYYCFTE
jgi:hypothetical protein